MSLINNPDKYDKMASIVEYCVDNDKVDWLLAVVQDHKRCTLFDHGYDTCIDVIIRVSESHFHVRFAYPTRLM